MFKLKMSYTDTVERIAASSAAQKRITCYALCFTTKGREAGLGELPGRVTDVLIP